MVGIDPHRKTFTATILDPIGRDIDHRSFDNDPAGHAEVMAWAAAFGHVDRWGIEGASGLDRHLAQVPVDAGADVRDVPPHRTSQWSRGRHEGKTDRLDSHRVAAETQTNPRLACAFKQAEPSGPNPVREQITLWHKARKSLPKIRVQLLGEIDALVHDLPNEMRTQLGGKATISARVNALANLDASTVVDPTIRLRLQLIEHRSAMLREVLEQDKLAASELAELVKQSGSSLTELTGLAARAAAEILVEVGDINRFSEAGFARFNGTAPIPASSAEGDGELVRHRLSRGGSRRLNAVIHRMAMIQLRFEPRARTIYDNARANGHTRREAMRVLKRNLSNVIYRTMAGDARTHPALT